MRVIHVVPSVAEEASGLSYIVPRLCEGLIEAGADAHLATLDGSRGNPLSPYLKTFPRGLGPHKLGASPQMYRWLSEKAAYGQVDLIHNHSLWMMPTVYPGKVCRRYSNCRLIVSPQGTLSPWALDFHPLRKRLFWRFLQGPAIRLATCFHATGEGEYQDIRALGFTQPICILPCGIDVPPLSRTPAGGRRRLLFLGRIHPIKGLKILLRAWSALQDRFSEWDLHVAGPDNDGHLTEMRALAAELKLGRLVFRGPLYGAEKLNAYRSADLFVLPTHSDSFAMTVAEALAAGTPAIVTVGAPWSKLPREGAGWWIEIGVDSLVACLEEALASSPTQLAQMGLAGRRWMEREYEWRSISEQCAATYHWLLQGGDTPAWVRMN
jgi:glycosyltransferase involved in cell wall biosynthesis